MPTETTVRPQQAARPFVAPAGSNAVVTLAAIGLVVGLVYLGTTNDLVVGLVTVGAALYIALLAVLGSTRLGILTLAGAFATAPAYKGLAPEGATVTPTDALLVVGFALLLPEILRGKLKLPLPYIVGITVVFTFGWIATIRSERSLESAFALIFWLIVMTAFPVGILLWRPARRVIHFLAWTYVAGHVASWAGGIVTGGITPQGRHFGMTNHPNYFAEAAIMAIALLIFLFFEYKHWVLKTATMGAAAVCGISILFSGSRGATIIVAVLVLMIPIVERSAITGFFYALVGATVVAAAPYLLEITGNASAIDRLLGGGSASGSDIARSEGLRDGLSRFWESPFFGDGLIDLFEIHNNVLQVAVGIGIFGLVGFLLVMFSLARPLFEDVPYRRLCYTVWGYLGWGLLIPSLYDRTLWIPMCLAAVCWVASADWGDDHPDKARSTALAGPDGSDAAGTTGTTDTTDTTETTDTMARN
ncbi:O-antigen ligase family protein [Nocardioides sp. J54]|uniref:O-antigen ligase family protein n=1 Tax=Nocardioides sp. J54 TaxID=935866 RepID=UPI00048D3374|nr:O-antigen ligase family protein [Nocardioides sp. J54]